MAAMGTYNLVADPDSLNPGAVQGWIDHIEGAPNGSTFLSNPNGGGTITVTDNPSKLSKGNLKSMEDKLFQRDNVRVTDPKKLFKEFNGFSQDKGKTVFINPD